MARKAVLSLAEEFPSLLREWNYERNNICPTEVTRGSSKKAWWICELGHEWETAIGDRTRRNQGCPYCSNRMLWVGYNDMWTTNPELASILANHEDGYKYMQGSGKYVDWKCSSCNNITKNKQIRNVKNQGISCCYCSPSVSIGERIMSNTLKELSIDFEYQKTFEWLKNRRYDFYLSKDNIIIETHGGQHYSRKMFKDPKIQKKIDKIKEDSAQNNGISEYIVIDCSSGEIEKIKQQIESSTIRNFIKEEIRWYEVAKNSATREMREIWELWNSGMDVKEISNSIKLDKASVCRHLKHGYIARECSYTVDRAKYNTQGQRAVVQMDLKGNFIKEYKSLKKASEAIGANTHGMISQVCSGIKATSAGFRWLYKEDYDKLSDNNGTVQSFQKPLRWKSIVQLTLDGDYIKE